MSGVTFVNIDVISNSDCRTCHIDSELFIVEKEPILVECSKCHDN